VRVGQDSLTPKGHQVSLKCPTDVSLFLKMKIKSNGRRFDTVEEILADTLTVLNTLTKKHFQGAVQKSQKCWGLCVCAPKGTTLMVVVQYKIHITRNSFY
jgi:hypothetical protein